MTKFKSQSFKAKIENARHGINLALRAEKNLRVHTVIAALVILAGLLLQVGTLKLAILLLTIAIVVIAEMMNSALEFAVDALYKNKYSRLVKFAKDISAGAVLFVSFIAAVIGFLIFIPEIIK
ncbi:MAG: diacylglycerol kinase family protein [Fusobacterium sp.]|nr:diacylglycerol kinase family protein [Fusobacterium sp.]